MCSARHFRTLPVTPVVGPRLALANGLLLPATSRSCADFRPCLEGGPLPEGTYHPLAVRPANGYPSLALLPNGPAPDRPYGVCHESYKHGPNRLSPGNPRNWPKMGGGKKGPKLSRLGELLNTQKNVHFFAPPGGSPPGSPKVHPRRPPKGGFLRRIRSSFGPKKAQKWPILGVPEGVPGRPRGAPGRPGPGPEISRARPRGSPRGAPGRGVPEGVPDGVPGRGSGAPIQRPRMDL